jgi:acyl-CoA reductase-like NAD-dependent aldehyde dehydrogenase
MHLRLFCLKQTKKINMDEYKFYLAGAFKSSASELKVVNPYTGEAFALTYLAGQDDIEQAIIAGLKAEDEMKKLPSWKRFEILKYISENLLTNKKRLAEILSMECGKPIRYALAEIERSAQTFLIAAEESKRLPKEYVSLDWTKSGTGKEGIIKYFPVGLIAGIAPFNFPMNLAVHKIAPALASGSPIILKPARSTPLSVIELAKIIDQTDLPKGAVSIMTTNREAGNLLVTDSRFKMLSFTGSPEIGWAMKNNAGKKKVLLELGGNAGVIVAQSANLELAIGKILMGSFAYSGQVCIHVQRIYVHKSLFDRFIDVFTEKVRKLRIGDPLSEETDVSVMIDEENAIRVENWVNEAVEQGARVLCGGRRNGSMYEPTILTQTKREMKVCAMEIFGPVVTVEPYTSFEQAVSEVNHSEFGLQAGVFTNQLNEMHEAFDNLEVGGVIINDVPTFRVDHMPYGGLKNSGFGREGVKYSIAEMMEAKLLVMGQ